VSLTYILQIDGPDKLVKIGRSRNVRSRITSLKTGLPWPLRVVALIGSDVERELKQKFAAHRVQGEWFKPSQEMHDWLVEAASEGKLVRQVSVDQGYINAVIKPRIREYLKGREPENNASGDLVRCILNDLLPTLAGRENSLVVATKHHVTEAICRGYGPTNEVPELHLPSTDMAARAA
jgi:hypothetical protein